MLPAQFLGLEILWNPGEDRGDERENVEGGGTHCFLHVIPANIGDSCFILQDGHVTFSSIKGKKSIKENNYFCTGKSWDMEREECFGTLVDRHVAKLT